MGFCLLNNVAIAAEHALKSVDRVAIVDWDVHHGNGTQHAFYRTNRVLYCSVHQEYHFPYSGSVEEIGNGYGKGFTVNAPVGTGSSGADIALVFSEVFLPALERFRPDCLLVSAGQDILSDDPLGGMNVTARRFQRVYVIAPPCRLSAGTCAGGRVRAFARGCGLPYLFSTAKTGQSVLSQGTCEREYAKTGQPPEKSPSPALILLDTGRISISMVLIFSYVCFCWMIGQSS